MRAQHSFKFPFTFPSVSGLTEILLLRRDVAVVSRLIRMDFGFPGLMLGDCGSLWLLLEFLDHHIFLFFIRSWHFFSAHCLDNICWCFLLLLSSLSALVSAFYLLVIFSNWMPFNHPVCSDFHGLFFIPPSVFHAKHHAVELILFSFVFWPQWYLPSAVSYIPM